MKFKYILFSLAFISGYLYSNDIMSKENCLLYQDKLTQAMRDSEYSYNIKNEKDFKKFIDIEIKAISDFNENKCYLHFPEPEKLKQNGENVIKALYKVRNKGIVR